MSRGLFWFRSDLRLKDNPALSYACKHCEELAIVYFYNKEDKTNWKLGSASKWWLHQSLVSLRNDLSKKDIQLQLIIACPSETLLELCLNNSITQVFWNRLYEPDYIERDKTIKEMLLNNNIKVKSLNASLLYEPWEVSKPDGTPYRVFTPFWKMMQKQGLNHSLTANIRSYPKNLNLVENTNFEKTLKHCKLLPKVEWDKQFYQHWQPGELGAQKIINKFFKNKITHYKSGRDFPNQDNTSKISPHLHFGEISSRQILVASSKKTTKQYAEPYIRQLAWREFAHHLLYHFPNTSTEPLNRKYARFSWAKSYKKDLVAWQMGNTGIPIVDAGMRELWITGWMHNRVRMIVGSILTKNLLIPWQVGSQWFWDTLVDADLANNTMGWQWIAGCGADAAPYYRIFNPVLQSKKFDSDAVYIKTWVPELASLPNKLTHAPWESSEEELRQYNVVLGKDYPEPIINLKTSRERALEAYNSIK